MTKVYIFTTMKKLLSALLLLVLLVVSYVLFRTFTFSSSQIDISPVEKVPSPEGAAERFAEAISIRTVSFGDPADFDSTQFRAFNAFLENNYPLIHQLEHQVFNDFSHLFTWKGTDASLKPIVLMGHTDVVPIASPRKWSVHPFTEGIKNDTIYGRGAIDDKFGVICVMEAVEQMLSGGYQPKRTIYLSLGHDEELLGTLGAVESVQYLKERGVEAEFVLDEGGAITKGIFPGLEDKVAVVGIAEKGYVSMELSVDMAGGHSSTPEPESAIDVLSAAVYRAKSNPMPARITPVLHGFMDKLGPEMPFMARMAFANRTLFKSKIIDLYSKSASGNASVRTTTAPTIIEAGIKENVIPTHASAVINFRILPGDNVEGIAAHLREVINDERINIELLSKGTPASPVSPIDVTGYQVIERSIKETIPDVMVAPYLVVGATDSRHFTPISKNIYRFLPYHITPHNLKCFHGIDERVGVDEYLNGIRFYRRIIENSNQ